MCDGAMGCHVYKLAQPRGAVKVAATSSSDAAAHGESKQAQLCKAGSAASSRSIMRPQPSCNVDGRAGTAVKS